MYKKAIGICIVVATFILPFFAFADISQTDSSVNYNGGGFVANIPYQEIGNGFTGYLTSFEYVNSESSFQVVSIY